ncbi:pyrroline-5-carboxylate reductase [Williamsoniiplasma luminosum]|uniref:Pyrroline-5-carboxylate reductase n=1 Tax=Williamsoniiplasma luminosum TaxID=214888 RepID=A0A2K8NVI0_9MOLU|nr:pyrroline-5-carboxylate reductase [Williamsoniiplasma luminosum]ATZ16751.1 pyrroline-5-carboxylate reductase [Williamsoniiplasma luminosum]
MKVGIIGLGHMGSSLVKGMQNDHVQILGYHYDDQKSVNLSKELDIQVTSNLSEFVQTTDLIILSVRTNIVSSIIDQIKNLAQDKIILSLISGLSIPKMLAMFDHPNQKIVRIMPNLNAEIQMSATGICYTNNFSQLEKDEINSLVQNFGEIYEIPEEQFEIFTILGGVSPAWFFKMINVMQEIGVEHGMNTELAKKVATQAGIGSLTNLMQSKYSPLELMNQVAVPGGVTIESIKVLNEHQFDEIIKKATKKALEKDKKTFSK